MPNPVIHFEIGCKDRPKTIEFYRKWLGWEIEADGPAAMIDTKAQTGIQGHISSLGHPPHNYITVYAQVSDIQAALKRAEELGGKVIVPAVEVPGMGHFAWVGDPEGTIFGVWKPLNAQP